MLRSLVRTIAHAALLGLALISSASAAVRWKEALRQPDAWYAADEAEQLAANVVRYQTPPGGWPKNTDFSKPPSASFLARSAKGSVEATIDNGGTTTPLHLLARVLSARGDAAPPDLRAAFFRGFDYLLASQYENGGWPQYFPLKKGYYTHITYNDNAMVNVLSLLRDAARGEPRFAFVDADRRARAAGAVAKGIDCILRTQAKRDGRLTAWCAQHDEKTLAPAWARKYEPPSLSGSESVGIVRFLMEIENPSPEIIASIEGAVAWFEKARLEGLRVERVAPGAKADRRVVRDPSAPPIWARFYELETDRPLFLDRDSVPHYDYAEITAERRGGYAYYGSWPAELLAKDYPRWRQRLKPDPVRP